jgi:hypothetical protein
VVAEAHLVLGEWRRGERLRTLLPPEAPERGELGEQIDALRDLYQQLTSAADGMATGPTASRRIERSVRLMDQLSARYAIDPTAQPVEEG